MSEEVEKNEPSVPSTYYGINLRLTEGLKRPDGVPLYCTSIQEVQAVMKTNKTARFKSFGTQEEAEAFSRLAADPPPDGPAATPAAPSPITCGPSAVGGEKPSPFKNPTRTDFQSFRQLVESGDERGVVAAVARNPRYLVSSGDTPALLREGPRQNSLHLAALRGRHAVCRALLRLAGDPALFQKLYPDDAPEVAAGRADYMSDLYLNMPTKGAFETPLHLAAKLGHLETVRVLVQHPACKRDLTNKFGDTPEQVSCQQYSASDRDSVRRQIGFLLQEPFYVQVLAEADGSGAPVLAPPCSPQQQRGRPWSGTTGTPGTPQTPPMSPELTASPLGSPLRPRAWAGPMPRQLADEFHKRWRSPLSVSPLKSRSPARCEDVRLTDAEKGWERVGRELASEMSVEWREFWPFLGRHLDLASEEGLQALEEHLHRQTCRLMDTTANLEEVARRLSPSTPPQRPTPRSPPGHPRPSPLSPVSALCRDLHELRLEDRTVEEEAAEVAPPIPATATVAPRRGRLRELLRRQCSEPLPRELDSDNSDVEEEFYTPPSSVESGSPATPGQAPEVFIHGRHPTADDLDALRALESAKVDRARYPAVCNWRSQVVTRSRTQGFKRVPRAASPPPSPAAAPAAAAAPSPRRRSPRVSPVWALIGGTSSNRAPNPRPFTTPRRPTCRPPAVPEGDGSPLARPAASRLPLLRHTPRVNGHL